MGGGEVKIEVDVEAELCKKQRVSKVHYFLRGGWVGCWVSGVEE